MKRSVAPTIDKILKIDPQLENKLAPIKAKAELDPSRRALYWKKLLDVLNSKKMQGHPKRDQIKKVLNPDKKRSEVRYSFNNVEKNDHIFGVIPENISDKIRRHDRYSIKLAKTSTEAQMTMDIKTMAELNRKHALLDVNLSKIWIEVKDHFNLWDVNGNYNIKRDGAFLVITDMKIGPHQRQLPNGSQIVMGDPNAMKNFFESMGMQPPPGMFPEDDSNEPTEPSPDNQ